MSQDSENPFLCPGCARPVERPGPGRPSRLTPGLAVAIADHITNGYSKAAALRKLDVPESTFFDWQAKAGDGKEPYRTLLRCVVEAEEDAIRAAEEGVRTGVNIRGEPDWHAKEAWLKARRPEVWAKRVRIEQVQQEVTMAFIEIIERRRPHLRDEFVTMLIEEEEGVEALPPDGGDG